MKQFIEILQNHPGILYGNLMTALGFYAGVTNKVNNSWIDSIEFGFLCYGIMGVIVWTPILITTYLKLRDERGKVNKELESSNPLIAFMGKK